MQGKSSPDGLKDSPNNVNITKITVMKNMREKVKMVNLITNNVTPERMLEINLCHSFPGKEPSSWVSGTWKHLNAKGTELPLISNEESIESVCNHKPYFLILPLQGLWIGKGEVQSSIVQAVHL